MPTPPSGNGVQSSRDGKAFKPHHHHDSARTAAAARVPFRQLHKGDGVELCRRAIHSKHGCAVCGGNATISGSDERRTLDEDSAARVRTTGRRTSASHPDTSILDRECRTGLAVGSDDEVSRVAGIEDRRAVAGECDDAIGSAVFTWSCSGSADLRGSAGLEVDELNDPVSSIDNDDSAVAQLTNRFRSA